MADGVAAGRWLRRGVRKLLLFIYFFFRFNYDLMSMHFDSIPDAIADIRKGRMVIVTDDADRENEGDLVMAASKITPTAVNFMAKYGAGVDLRTNHRRTRPPIGSATNGRSEPRNA